MKFPSSVKSITAVYGDIAPNLPEMVISQTGRNNRSCKQQKTQGILRWNITAFPACRCIDKSLYFHAYNAILVLPNDGAGLQKLLTMTHSFLRNTSSLKTTQPLKTEVLLSVLIGFVTVSVLHRTISGTRITLLRCIATFGMNVFMTRNFMFKIQGVVIRTQKQ